MGKEKKPLITLLGQQQDTDNQNVFEIEALADTGADACIMDETKWKSIPGKRSRLRHCNMRLTGANGSVMHVAGELDLELVVKQSPQHRIRTNVIVVRNLNTPFILSMSALKQLSIISPDFPSVLDYNKTCEANAITQTVYKDLDHAPCGCPKRMPVLDPPKEPLCELKMENRKLLETFLKKYFVSSAFNQCKHQQLPVLKGKPMRILINETHIKPTAVNKPANIPRACKVLL